MDRTRSPAVLRPLPRHPTDPRGGIARGRYQSAGSDEAGRAPARLLVGRRQGYRDRPRPGRHEPLVDLRRISVEHGPGRIGRAASPLIVSRAQSVDPTTRRRQCRGTAGTTPRWTRGRGGEPLPRIGRRRGFAQVLRVSTRRARGSHPQEARLGSAERPAVPARADWTRNPCVNPQGAAGPRPAKWPSAGAEARQTWGWGVTRNDGHRSSALRSRPSSGRRGNRPSAARSSRLASRGRRRSGRSPPPAPPGPTGSGA